MSNGCDSYSSMNAGHSVAATIFEIIIEQCQEKWWDDLRNCKHRRDAIQKIEILVEIAAINTPYLKYFTNASFHSRLLIVELCNGEYSSFGIPPQVMSVALSKILFIHNCTCHFPKRTCILHCISRTVFIQVFFAPTFVFVYFSSLSPFVQQRFTLKRWIVDSGLCNVLMFMYK